MQIIRRLVKDVRIMRTLILCIESTTPPSKPKKNVPVEIL